MIADCVISLICRGGAIFQPINVLLTYTNQSTNLWNLIQKFGISTNTNYTDNYLIGDIISGNGGNCSGVYKSISYNGSSGGYGWILFVYDYN